jgi:hypothetical protein
MSLVSGYAAVQAERAVGERSLSGRVARPWPPPSVVSIDVSGEGPAGSLAERRRGVVDGDRRGSSPGRADRELFGVVVAYRELAEYGPCVCG